jgi:hypothetical protein
MARILRAAVLSGFFRLQHDDPETITPSEVVVTCPLLHPHYSTHSSSIGRVLASRRSAVDTKRPRFVASTTSQTPRPLTSREARRVQDIFVSDGPRARFGRRAFENFLRTNHMPFGGRAYAPARRRF